MISIILQKLYKMQKKVNKLIYIKECKELYDEKEFKNIMKKIDKISNGNILKRSQFDEYIKELERVS